MGKLKKRNIGQTHRSDPLSQQILENGTVKTSTRIKHRNRQEENEEFVSDKLSKKILEQARKQQEELEEEYVICHDLDKRSFCQSVSLDRPSSESEDMVNDILNPLANVLINDQLPKKNLEQAYQQDIEKVLSCSPTNRISPGNQGSSQSENKMAVNVSHLPSDIEVSEEDEKALKQFMNEDESVRITLGEVIKEKLTEKETEIQTQFSDAGSLKIQNLDKLMPIYRGVGQVLARYRSGKLPKAFKSIPRFQNWEEILYLTEPDNWSSAAMYQATRIFASNLKEKMAQRFYNRILLPRIRDELEQCKILNFHLYEALKKSLFKPGAFFKGIILPLCESGTCTLKDATIIGSVIAKFSIPVLHSSVAIIKISDMDYSGANSLFLRILLEKKYALPFRTIDAVVAHFLRFALDKRELPLLWHQCLLSFAQLYKNDISSEQQDSLLSLLTVHCHPHVTPEIRRELGSAKFRRSTPKENEESCKQMCDVAC